MFFDEIIHGTQYYRTPTPTPSEWEGDIERMEEFNIDAFQIRMNWRWNERKEDRHRTIHELHPCRQDCCRA